MPVSFALAGRLFTTSMRAIAKLADARRPDVEAIEEPRHPMVVASAYRRSELQCNPMPVSMQVCKL